MSFIVNLCNKNLIVFEGTNYFDVICFIWLNFLMTNISVVNGNDVNET